MRLFYFLARNISYTFAVAFFISVVGFFEGMYSYLLASSFILASYEKLFTIFIQWLPIVFGINLILFFIFSGFFTPVKLPAFMKRHRRINRIFKSDFTSEFPLKEAYGDFSDLVMNNTTASALFSIAVAIGMMIVTFYKFYMAGDISLFEARSMIKIIILATIIFMLVYGITAHLFGEYLTNNERAFLYNEILKNGELIKPHALLGVMVNFAFFIIVMIIIIFTFAALLERTRMLQQWNTLFIAAFLVIGVFSTFFFVRINAGSILNILTDMARVTREIASGQRAGFRVLSLGKEFSYIEYALMEMAWEIDEHRRNLEIKVQERTEDLERTMNELKLRDEQIQKQLDMASVIQRSILPSRLDDWNELKFAVRYRAMEKIGGDFYDVFQMKDNKIGILMADVSGHGIPAALVTAMAKISFGNAGAMYGSPKRIFQEVNRNIIDHMKTQDYMTCFMVSIDDNYNIIYSNASHQKAILLHSDKNEIEYLDTNGLFLGALEEARDTYEEKTTKLEYGDRLILYTDGIPEAQNRGKEEYSHERFERAILEHKEEELESFIDSLLMDVRDHIGDMGAIDDISILVVELTWDEAIDIIKYSKKLINSHKYLEAIEMLESGLSKYHDNQKILYNLGKNYFRVNNFSKAVQTLDSYIENDKKNKFAYYIIGAAHYQMMDYRNAIDKFNLALGIDPNMSNALFALGMCYKNLGDYEDAVQIFERVINIDAGNKMAIFEIKQIEKLKGMESSIS